MKTYNDEFFDFELENESFEFVNQNWVKEIEKARLHLGKLLKRMKHSRKLSHTKKERDIYTKKMKKIKLAMLELD